MAQAPPSGAHVHSPPTHRSAAYFAPQHPSQVSGGDPAHVESDVPFVELHAAIDNRAKKKNAAIRGIDPTSTPCTRKARAVHPER
jgi:hypothetical protein